MILLRGPGVDVYCMAAAAELHGERQSGLSPELVLVDAALSAEVRRLLVPPADTIERLLAGRPSEARPEEAVPLAELAGDGKSEDELSANQMQAVDAMHPDEVEEASNSYPALPSPPAEGVQKDATETVLRLIAGTS